MRICFLAETFYPEAKDGLTVHAYQLAECLISKGAELFVITRKMERNSKRFERVGNVPVRRISPVGRLKGKGWKALGPILRLLATMPVLLVRYIRQYDVIMVSGVKVLSISAALMSAAFGKKSVIKIESPSELYEDISGESLRKMHLSTSSPALKLFRMVRNPIIRKADCFIAISEEIRQQLVDFGVDRTRILCIANGIDIRKFSPATPDGKRALRRKLSLPDEATIVVYSGRLVTSKGIPLLVETWRDLLRDHENIHLVLVGSGRGSFDDCEDDLVRYIREAGLEPHVSITGIVDNVNEYLMASDIFVLPSDYEGFSLALIEGLACALPVVATRVGGAGNLIRDYHNGILINPKDKKELKEAIEWMFEHKMQWAALGENAREAAERYSMESVADQYVSLFTQLTEAGNPEWSRDAS